MKNSLALSGATLRTIDPESLPVPSQIVSLLGSSRELHPLLIRSFLARTARGATVGAIVGDNRFHAYKLARLARAHHLNPDVLLTRIQLSRPFTCYQLHRRVVTIDSKTVQSWAALYVLGLLDTFYDEDVPHREAARLLREIARRLRELAADGLPILITLSQPPERSPRQQLVSLILEASDSYWQPSPPILQLAAQQFTLP